MRFKYYSLNSWRDGKTFFVYDDKIVLDCIKKGVGCGNTHIVKKFDDKKEMLEFRRKLNKGRK